MRRTTKPQPQHAKKQNSKTVSVISAMFSGQAVTRLPRKVIKKYKIYCGDPPTPRGLTRRSLRKKVIMNSLIFNIQAQSLTSNAFRDYFYNSLLAPVIQTSHVSTLLSFTWLTRALHALICDLRAARQSLSSHQNLRERHEALERACEPQDRLTSIFSLLFQYYILSRSQVMRMKKILKSTKG